MVDASPEENSTLPDPAAEVFDAGEWRARAANVSTRKEFGALISALASAARVSVGAVKTHVGGTRAVYDWFSGRTLPRNASDARRLADFLGKALDRRYPDAALTEPVYDAWQRLAERRQEDAAIRAVTNRRVAVGNSRPTRSPAAGDGFGTGPGGRKTAEASTPPESPAAPPPEQPAPPGENRARAMLCQRRTVLLAVMSLLVAAVGGFAVTRNLVGPPRYTVLPCGESVSVNPQGYVRMYSLDGPPGDAYPKQHSELRMQTEDAVGWIAYAYLTQPATDRDRAWLDWSDVKDPDDARIQHCEAQPVNQVRKTVGVRARSPLGAPRWFRVCASVPDELRIVGRGPKACGSWVRPDD